MESKVAILDSGALVAFLSRNDSHHLWAKATFKKLPPSLVTTEAVLSEIFFLLRKDKRAIEIFSELLSNKIIKVFSLVEELDRLLALIDKYSDIPMSYADATLVRLAELTPHLVVVSTDSDFAVYRMKKNQKIPAVLPR